jgi:hypothetical protein
MNKTSFFRPHEVIAKPVWFLPPKPIPNLFNVYVRHSEVRRDTEKFSLVHIPPEVQFAFAEGIIRGLQIDALKLNGVEMQYLEGQPYFAVLGVELTDGRKISCIPDEFKHAYRKKLKDSTIRAALGLLLLPTSIAWLGVFAIGLAARCAHIAMSIPRKAVFPK